MSAYKIMEIEEKISTIWKMICNASLKNYEKRGKDKHYLEDDL